MVIDYRLRRAGAVSTAPPDGRDTARGFLLERHLHERLGAREGSIARLSEDEC